MMNTLSYPYFDKHKKHLPIVQRDSMDTLGDMLAEDKAENKTVGSME